jgi:hypothetical protein
MFDDEPTTQPDTPAQSRRETELEALAFILELRVMLLLKRLAWTESVLDVLLDERDNAA